MRSTGQILLREQRGKENEMIGQFVRKYCRGTEGSRVGTILFHKHKCHEVMVLNTITRLWFNGGTVCWVALAIHAVCCERKRQQDETSPHTHTHTMSLGNSLKWIL